MPWTVFATAPVLAPEGVALLDRAGCRVLYLPKGEGRAGVDRIMAAEAVDAVISRTVELSAAAIDACPTLKVVSKHGVGVSNIDVGACTRRGIPVYVTPGANAQSVAELAFGLMLAAARRIAWMDREIRAGQWPRAQDGVELSGRVLGLAGFGQIGRRVAHLAGALGMTIRAYDPAISPGSKDGVEFVGSLRDVFAGSDVVSLHLPLTPQTRAVVDGAALAALPRGAILINTARGEIVDEPALVEALRSGQLFAAGLDTTAEEPLPAFSPLRELPNVILTPHVGGSTSAALTAMATGAAENVLGFLGGRPPGAVACVNPEVLSTSRA
jgi:D-3-phosphoglycerate dehydrogenase / 2-oxoglutarate reductase